MIGLNERWGWGSSSRLERNVITKELQILRRKKDENELKERGKGVFMFGSVRFLPFLHGN